QKDLQEHSLFMFFLNMEFLHMSLPIGVLNSFHTSCVPLEHCSIWNYILLLVIIQKQTDRQNAPIKLLNSSFAFTVLINKMIGMNSFHLPNLLTIMLRMLLPDLHHSSPTKGITLVLWFILNAKLLLNEPET